MITNYSDDLHTSLYRDRFTYINRTTTSL